MSDKNKPEDFLRLNDFIKSELFKEWLDAHSPKDIHYCYDCPIIQDEIEDSIALWSLHICKYHHIESFIDDLREICEFCFCEKLGTKLNLADGACDRND